MLKYIKAFESFIGEKELSDEKVGKEFWFEYHCLESPESEDAEAWYRSHQRVVVLSVSDWSHDTLEERIEDGYPRTYRVKFLEDGFEWDVFEDELLNSQEEFFRPDPPSRN